MDAFTLDTALIPKLQRRGIGFRYIAGIYDPMTIIVTCKNLDICRVDVNCNSHKSYNYNVYWFASVFKNARYMKREYLTSQELIDDIHKAIIFKGEDKMNNKMYKVSDVKARASCMELDELIVTVKPLTSRGIKLEDCDRIKAAIESIRTHDDSIDALAYAYCKADAISTYRLTQMFNKTPIEIKDVIFNNPATIVLWTDGTKTVVKAENEEFDPEKGLAMAIAKKTLGNNYEYYDIFKKYVGRYEKKQKKGGK